MTGSDILSLAEVKIRGQLSSNLSFVEVNCQVLWSEILFMAMGQWSRKMHFAIIKPTIYLPKRQFSIQLSPF